MPALVDAHCHLGDAAFDDDRLVVLARAVAAGVTHVVVIGESLPGSARAATLARAPGLSATAGVHPHEAASWDAAAPARLRRLLDIPEIVAVGETGLDYHYDHAPRPAQRAAFEGQLALAADLGKPVVIHARDADDDMAALLRDWGGRIPALVLHSFAGSRSLFTAGMDVGAYFSFSGMITFKNWRPAVPASECPGNRLLVETDAPYLAPVPHRGHRNEPAFVPDIVTALARQRDASPVDLARQTFENASRVFGPRLLTPLASREDSA